MQIIMIFLLLLISFLAGVSVGVYIIWDVDKNMNDRDGDGENNEAGRN